MTWTNNYKKSIDCNNPKGFSQKAHCQARKLRQMGKKTESKPVNEAKNNMNEDFGIAKALSPITHRKSYKMAKKTLGDVMKRKQDSTKGSLYYAAQVAKSYPGVDAKKLASMHEETIEETIRHEGSKWNIYSKDGSKRLGSYDTEEAAKKRLRQIEYFKHMGEDAPANVAGSGAVAGLGVGPQGEPGVNMKKKRKVIPFAMFVRKKPNQ